MLSFEDKVIAINHWQDGEMHPLTCGNCRSILFPAVKDGKVILNCECGYIQKHVPEVVYESFERRWRDEDATQE